MKKSKILLSAIAITLAIFVIFFFNQCSEKESELTKITFRLDWVPGAEHSFLYAAQSKGYFKDEGLEVTIQAGDGSTTAAKLVGNGTVDYALCSGDTALMAFSKGTPVKVLAVLYNQPPTVIYSRKDRNIVSPKDLEGKKYGAYVKSTTYKQFIAFCETNELDLSKVEVVPTAGKAQDILTDAVDASGGYAYIQPVQCEIEGVPVNEIYISDYGVNPYSMSIITNKNKQNPEVTRSVVEVALKAFQEMAENPAESLDIYLKGNPTANKAFEEKKILKLSQFLKKIWGPKMDVGQQTMDGWAKTQEFLISQQLMDAEVQLADFFTIEFLPVKNHK